MNRRDFMKVGGVAGAGVFVVGGVLSRRDTIAIALDGVQDPGNVGTIVRLAAAFDAAGVLLLPGCADAFGPKAIRSSAGAILTVPVARISADELIAANVPLIATAMHGATDDPPASFAPRRAQLRSATRKARRSKASEAALRQLQRGGHRRTKVRIILCEQWPALPSVNRSHSPSPRSAAQRHARSKALESE